MPGTDVVLVAYRLARLLLFLYIAVTAANGAIAGYASFPTQPACNASLRTLLQSARPGGGISKATQRNVAVAARLGGGRGHPLCRLTRGSWCPAFHKQRPQPYFPSPRNALQCPNACSNTGVCNHDTGVCDCPAGFTGPDCSLPLKRPCTNKKREAGAQPSSHVGPDGRDLDWTKPGWLPGRCAGICDTDTGSCFCDGKYAPVKAAAGSPYSAGDIRRGRPLSHMCTPKQTYDGKPVHWGQVPYAHTYGPRGWCNVSTAETAIWTCDCPADGWGGPFCQTRYEMTCVNQCSGHGHCMSGFCACHPGWYGHDCARQAAGVAAASSSGAVASAGLPPWVAGVTALAPELLPQAQRPGQAGTRKRPLIYVYDLPSEFNTRLLQYKTRVASCVWRNYVLGNTSVMHPKNLYALEAYFHEALLQSEHRTLDPARADFFFVPTYTTCLINPIYAHLDFPWYSEVNNGPVFGRTYHASFFVRAAKRWLQSAHPWWNRTQGRDHIWLALHDEGSCWFPSEVANTSILLTHWGRTDTPHETGTAYLWDEYSGPKIHPEWQPRSWRYMWEGRPCFNPAKDLVVPSYKDPHHFKHSPLLGAQPRARDWLLFFQGDIGGNRLEHYSRGIRQTLAKLAEQQNWRRVYQIHINGPGKERDYGACLARSVFCLVAPGDGWSARMEDAVLHGCVPVIIQDNVQVPFESILDLDSFSVRVQQSHMSMLPSLLLAIPPDKVVRMQRRITRVWSRYAWTSAKLQRTTLDALHQAALQASSGPLDPTQTTAAAAASLRLSPHHAAHANRSIRSGSGSWPDGQHWAAPVPAPWPHHSDAFHTVMAWLHGQLKARGTLTGR